MFQRLSFRTTLLAIALSMVLSLTAQSALAVEGSHPEMDLTDEGGITPAYIIPLFPQKESDLKNGFPPGMTQYSFWAARGSVAITKLSDNRVKMEFYFHGLIPYGVYTLWNVLETEPFKDEPLGEFGFGKHSVVADGKGMARKAVMLNKWPGKEFLLDYHADGKLSQSKGVYPGALWGKFPPEPKR